MSAPVGTFIVFGAELPPQVHMLSVTQHEHFHAAQMLDVSPKLRFHIYEDAFCRGAEYAIPGWNDECLLIVAGNYAGPHRDQVQHIAACLLADGFHAIDGQTDDDRGGKRARLVPVRPVTPRPGGAVAVPSEAFAV